MTTVANETKTRSSAASGAAAPAGAPQRGPSNGRRTVIAIIVLGCLAAAVYDGIHSRAQAEAKLARAAAVSAVPTVDVVHPKPGSDSQEIALPGNIQPYIDTPIYARTSGYLRKWYFDIGSHVRKGQLLATIETPELDEQLDQAKAQLKDAQANLQLAQITAARWKHLLQSNSVSRQSTDQAVSDLASKEALVASNEANVRRLQQLQAYEKIYAPFDGVITQRKTDIGDLIQGGANSPPQELFHLASIRTLRVYIPVPEIYSGAVRTGEKVAITLDEYPGRTFTGTLVRNSDAIDPATRTLNVEVDVANPEGVLRPGAYAFVHLTVPPARGAVTIPSNTLLFRSEGLRVGVVRDRHAQLVPITIGHDYGSSVEVVDGLKPTDAVIVDPADSLENGQPVRIGGSAQR